MTYFSKKIKSIIKAIWHKTPQQPDREYFLKLGMKMGIDTTFHPDFWTSGEPYLMSIGSHCQLTRGVKLFTHGGAQVARKAIPNFDCFGKVVIEDWVYIGNNALIMPGVTIQEGSLICAGAIVTRSVPAGMVVGGNPAKIICSVQEYIERNKKFNIGSKFLTNEEKKAKLLSLDNSVFIHKPFMHTKH